MNADAFLLEVRRRRTDQADDDLPILVEGPAASRDGEAVEISRAIVISVDEDGLVVRAPWLEGHQRLARDEWSQGGPVEVRLCGRDKALTTTPRRDTRSWATPELRVTVGDALPRDYLLPSRNGGEFFIGGADTNIDVHLDEPGIASAHLRIRRQNGRYVLKPLASRPPTYRNGQVVHGSTRLHHNDRLQLGSTECQFFSYEELIAPHEIPEKTAPEPEPEEEPSSLPRTWNKGWTRLTPAMMQQTGTVVAAALVIAVIVWLGVKVWQATTGA